jgi:hypothetical protein
MFEAFLAILRKRPGEVAWFVESQEEKSRADGKWMIGRSAVEVAEGLGEAGLLRGVSFDTGAVFEEARRADDLRLDIAGCIRCASESDGKALLVRECVR